EDWNRFLLSFLPMMRSSLLTLAFLFLCPFCLVAQQSLRPRILIRTDIGGTDPDDNQSMAHLLMYADRFDIEGLGSSPSYGSGSTAEILRMIDLYELDLPKLQKHSSAFPEPDQLRQLTK